MIRPTDLQRYIESDIEVTYRHRAGYVRFKRSVDVAGSIVAIYLAMPVLLAAVIAIWLEDRGTPFFVQKRVGQFGRHFDIYKLRTMRLEACEDAPAPSARGDSRITRVGAFLRKTSIDELPQLINVLRGDMALVGPRPEMPLIVDRYERWQHCRHLSKPGITGFWQVSVRKQIPLSHPDATKIDLAYIRSASTTTDFAVIIQTFFALINTRGAY